MQNHRADASGRSVNGWRIAGWTIASLVLLVPLIAMRFTEEVNWDGADFVFAGILVGGVGIAFELTVRMTRNYAYRAAVALALAAAFMLVWINAAVGIIGSEDNPLNLLYGVVLGVGIVGALVARFRAEGMARTLLAMALAQAFVALVALIAGEPASGAAEILVLNGFFVGLFLGSAWLFRQAARKHASPGTTL